MVAGYSGTPLAKKLGVKDGQRTWHLKMPESVLAEILDGSDFDGRDRFLEEMNCLERTVYPSAVTLDLR